MPAKASAIEPYVSGKKFRKLLERHSATFPNDTELHLSPSLKRKYVCRFLHRARLSCNLCLVLEDSCFVN